MRSQIKVAFSSGPDDLNRQLIERMQELYPELPLYVVSEFPPDLAPEAAAKWIPYHVCRSFFENFARCRWAFRGRHIRLAGVLLVPQVPYRRMRLIALLLSPAGFLAYNEHLGSFMLRPRCAGTILRHLLWRAKNFFRWQLRPGGHCYTFLWRLLRPREWRIPLLYILAICAGWFQQAERSVARLARTTRPLLNQNPEGVTGISVVIPTRNGKPLLGRLLPGLIRALEPFPSEVIAVDNGSEDDSAEWLQTEYPQVILEQSTNPLSFAMAVNLGIRRARYSHVCLLNNDMVLEPGFFEPLRKAFDSVPDLFCATAQIFFPEGMRREETGKAVFAQADPRDFPVRCDLPVRGEDLSYVLYGSGGCSLYSTAKLRALGCLDPVYEPAYVEDLDIGYRAWLQGWPSVFVSGARAEHRHRATTARYFSAEQLSSMLEINYLRFLRRAVVSPEIFGKLWGQALRRLRLLATGRDLAALKALRYAAQPRLTATEPRTGGTGVLSEELLLALGGGAVSVFPGRPKSARPSVLVLSPYLPYPLSHGGAVRMFNLMSRTVKFYDQVLICFCDLPDAPPPELLGICSEIVMVQRIGSHSRPSTARPDVVEEFDSPAFHAAVRQTIRKWRPAIAQLEFTQMAQYAEDCEPAKTILVEHDLTFDLYEQLLHQTDDFDIRRQLSRWRRFETEAWRKVSCVVAMSEKDRHTVRGTRAVCLPNGVDLQRFRPSSLEPDPDRILFIGSFAHLPNLMAVDYFLREVWPLLQQVSPTLHIIAGARHEYFRNYYQDRVKVDLDQPRIEVEGFVSDVRRAYMRATAVIAPLVASAGTNIKIVEAMAMGKAIVSSPSGINGLDLRPGEDLAVAHNAAQMAAEIIDLFSNPAKRRRLETRARETAARSYDWDRIAGRQEKLYRSLCGH